MSKSMKYVAIADDHSLLRKGLADFIDSEGSFKVIIEAADGLELLDKLSQAEQLPHICILDVNMPRLNGFDTIAKLRELWPSIRVLALSMFNNEYTTIKMLRSGADGFLLKNCDPDEFIHTMTVMCGHGYNDNIATVPTQQPSITPKELEFLKYCCRELAYKEIADKMGVSTRRVEDYRDNLFKKLSLSTRTGLVMYAVKAGLVHPDDY